MNATAETSTTGRLFTERRQRLLHRNPGWVFVLPGESAHFHYLVGQRAPRSVLVLGPRPGAVLFGRAPDERELRWEGPRATPSELGVAAAVADVRDTAALTTALQELVGDAETIGYELGSSLDPLVVDAARAASLRPERRGRGLPGISDPAAAVGELRVVKDGGELHALRRSGQVVAEAMHDCLGEVRPGVTEREVAARCELALAAYGAEGTAFDTIVAGGERATILHARPTDRVVAESELVLIDMGAQVAGYASDMSRTIAVGEVSAARQALIDLVAAAQRAAVGVLRPGATLDDAHRAASAVLARGLGELGVTDGSLRPLARYFPHRVGHWLGLEAHDPGAYRVAGEPRVFVPGTVLTVEPGLYLPADDDAVPPDLRGCGVRIEDTVLVTESEPEVLTARQG